MCEIGLKKFKNTVLWTYGINDLNGKVAYFK